MNVVVKNVAKVSLADIDLTGISVIAGENGAGKSTISRAVMALTSLSMRMPTLVKHERINSIIRDAIGRAFERVGAQFLFRPRNPEIAYCECELLLDVGFWDRPENLASWIAGEEVGGRAKSGLMIYPQEFLVKPEYASAFPIVRGEVLRILETKDEDYVRYILTERMNRVFLNELMHVDGKLQNACFELMNTVFGIKLAIQGEDVTQFSGFGAKPFSSIFYSEPEHRLDQCFGSGLSFGGMDRYSTGRSLAVEIAKNPLPSESKADSEEYRKTMDIVSKLADVLHGKLERDDRGLGFEEVFSSGRYKIQLGNMASGMKTMATIMRLLENKLLLPGGMIIIDEPESNLHPEWQLKFAYWLVELYQKLGMRLLLTTHSPYFARAIQKSVHDLNAGVCHFYMMIPDEENLDAAVSSRTYHAEVVDDRTEDIYESLARPMEEII